MPTVLYALELEGDANVDVVLRRVAPLQIPIATLDGRPVVGARVEVVNEVFESTTAVFSDESGWATIAMTAGDSLVVTPPANGDAACPRFVTFGELVRDDDDVAAPIVLQSIGEPRAVGENAFVLHDGGPHPAIRIAFVSEGYTDGDESFEDANGNGVCDNEPYLDANGDGAFTLGERFVDTNRNGRRDDERFVDANGDGVCNRNERALFLRASRDAVRAIFGLPVYREWKDRVEVVALFVPSAQAGSSFPTLATPIVRDTAFGSEFRSTNFVFRVNGNGAAVAVNDALGRVDALAVMTYDLFGVGREAAGSTIMLFGNRVGEVSFVAGHELGHALGGLGDEYFEYDGAPPYTRDEPGEPNLTRMSALGELKWRAFVRSGVAIPSPDGQPGTGAFEGGLYRRRGIARPAYNCLMGRRGPFCAVCADRMMTRLGRASELAQATSARAIVPRETVRGAVPVGVVVPDRARVESTQLEVDGAPHGPASRLSPFGGLLDAEQLAPGAHTIAIAVRYVDGWVERSPGASVTTARLHAATPSVASVRLKGNSLTIDGAVGFERGAVLLLDGGDRYPLEPIAPGLLRSVRSARGSLSALKLKKALRRAPTRRAAVVAADGARIAIEVP